MILARESSRRMGTDRRTGGAFAYRGSERRLADRRSGRDRRAEWPAVCIYCGKAYGVQEDWIQGTSTIESKIEFRSGVCPDCSTEKFPQFYR